MEITPRKSKRSLWQRTEPYLYLLPVLIIFGMFVYYPLVRTIRMSLSVVNSMGEIVAFSGIRNFVNLFSGHKFWNSLGLTLKFAVMIVPGADRYRRFLGLLATDRAEENQLFPDDSSPSPWAFPPPAPPHLADAV